MESPRADADQADWPVFSQALGFWNGLQPRDTFLMALLTNN